jgi:hypothetical protein
MLGRNLIFSAGGLIAFSALSGCDEIKDALEDAGLDDLLDNQCIEVCQKVGVECRDNAEPPAPELPGDFGGVEIPDDPLAACAANCPNEANRVFSGYSDCQIECILDTSCGSINDCWNVSSDKYADHCITDPPPPAVPEDDDSEFADAVDNPAVEEAVDSSGTPIYSGGEPPDMTGMWSPVEGEIDVSSNARAPGSPINTSLCFWDADPDDGMLNYCEAGVYGPDGNVMTSTAPISGDGGDGWSTIIEFEYDGAIVASIIFSGNRAGGTAAEMDSVDALVTYYQGLEIWEHSFTKWTLGGTCSITDCE